MSGMFNALNISATALTAERFRMDVISNNIANANTTRTTDGTPFRRSMVVLRPQNKRIMYKSPFLPNGLNNKLGRGVQIKEVVEDKSELRMEYMPEHPDAIQFGKYKGYVMFPNVNVVKEMVDMIAASRAYEANVTLMTSSKQMFAKALDIGVR